MATPLREAEATVLLQAGEALERLGLRWETLDREPSRERGRPDAVVKVGYPGGELDLVAEIKIRPTRDQLDPRVAPLGCREPARLLVADYINPKLADWLHEHQMFFLDAAGNAYLRDGGLFVWITGRRDRMRLEAEREQRRAFQPSGLKLILVLLSRPGLVESDYRTLAQAAGVALGTVQRVMRDLIEDGYVLWRGRSRRRLVEPRELLKAWTPAFTRNLRSRLLLGRFEAPAIDWWRETELRAYGALWGGEPAAALLTSFLKPGTLTIYAKEVPARLVVERRLSREDRGRVEFRKLFWRLEKEPETPETVPPVLVYADLQALGDARALETAERLARDRLDGLFQQHLSRRPR